MFCSTFGFLSANLARLARKNPKVLQNLCMFLSIDLQLEQEELKRAKKKSKGN